MDRLRELLQSLDHDEQSQFKMHLERLRSRRDGKSLKLFSWLISDHHDHQTYIHLTYGDLSKKSVNAFHSSRKRLKIELKNFITGELQGDEAQIRSNIEREIQFSEYLFSQSMNELAWKALKSSEELAIKNKHYELLNRTYNTAINYAHLSGAPSLSSLQSKRAANKILMDEDERVNLASCVMKKKLNKIRLSNEQINLEEAFQQVIEEFHLTDIVGRRPRILVKFISLMRTIYVSNKDFHSFLPIIQKHYENTLNSESLEKEDPLELCQVLYWLTHAYYRDKQFDEALPHLYKLKSLLPNVQKIQRQQMEAQTILLHAAIESFRGNNTISIDILEEHRDHYLFKSNSTFHPNLILNLGVYYFQQDRYADTAMVLSSLPHSESWYERLLGREFLFKRDLIMMITQIELGNEEIGLNRIRSIESRFRNLIDSPKYERARFFLKAVRMLIINPEKALDQSTISQSRQLMVNVPREEEDLQAMTYFAWLKSKWSDLPYYETLLDVVKN